MATDTAKELPKQYDHAEAQRKWYQFWLERGYFNSDPDKSRQPFTIVIPPPNVTGALHLGHALNNTLQDVLIRWRRMQGYNALWMPGTDHAGIATQAVVERRLLEEEKQSRHDLGREALVERIWAWKHDYEARILGQLKQMGCSCDWRRTRFTLDEVCARAVRHTFFRMFKDGLIYRGKRLVNWDTYLQTAVSDDEVFHETVAGHFWHFRYPVIDPKPGEPDHVTIATTRPETMLGDTAVAVHPEPEQALKQAEEELARKLAEVGERERAAIEAQLNDVRDRRKTLLPQLVKLRDMARSGRKLRLPLVNREIPLITDEWAKPELGSGCVKITPAHDPNDYEVWRRHDEIGAINILNPDGTLNENAGAYKGLKIHVARKRVVADLEAQGLLGDIEDREIELAHSDRSKTAIEPYLADQWFVRMDDLAQSAMDAVTDGRVEIVPPRYAKTYLDWLSEKRDWPVSRQLWWGHRVPVWTKKVGKQNLTPSVKLIHGDSYAYPGSTVVEFLSADERERIAVQDHTTSDGTKYRYICVGHDSPKVISKLEENGYSQDENVLDTWFSSALWPHSTLGWPGPPLPDEPPGPQNPDWQELKYYYPTSTLITSRDIITLWVARMVLTGLYNAGDVPFRQVFIHPKILDAYGETMSKTKGNGVDPLDVIDKFGADALRFGLAYMTTETQDIRMPVEFECPHCHALVEQTKQNRTQARVKCTKCGKDFSTQWARKPDDLALPRGAVVSDHFELGRNFCNKLWNASRFALMNLEGYSAGTVADDELALEDRWLLSRLATVTREVTAALETYRYAEAARSLYDFAWNEFCSFYVEMVKSRLQDAQSRATAQRVLAFALDNLMRLLHPFIPFLTEEVWQLLGSAAPERGLDETSEAAHSIMIAAWPAADATHANVEIEQRFARFQQVLGMLREARSRHNIPPRSPIRFTVKAAREDLELLQPMAPYFQSMAGASAASWESGAKAPPTGASFSAAGMEVFVDLADFIDVAAETARKQKEIARLEQAIAGKEKQLANENFVSRAPAEVIEKERAALAQLREQCESARASLTALVKTSK